MCPSLLEIGVGRAKLAIFFLLLSLRDSSPNWVINLLGICVGGGILSHCYCSRICTDHSDEFICS